MSLMLERIHLKIVQAVEEHGSLTAAAKELCVTQSALSHTIRELEDNLGTEIWPVSYTHLTLPTIYSV